MVWLKTEDGDLVNLDSGVAVELVIPQLGSEDFYKVFITGHEATLACQGYESECRDYIMYLEQDLTEQGHTIINPGRRFK